MIIADPGLANCRMINDWTNLPNYMQIQIRLLTFEFEALTNEQLIVVERANRAKPLSTLAEITPLLLSHKALLRRY